MPKVTLLTDTMPDLLPMQGRSPGLHVSAIIKDLCIIAGVFKAEAPENSETYMGLGKVFEFAWVQMMLETYPGRYTQLGELKHDGVFLTVDLYDVIEDEVVELKATWMSAFNIDPEGEKMWRYRKQLGAYCEAARTLKGRLVVCFVIGDYKGDSPRYRDWRFEWTREELAENWMMLKRHGEANRERLEEGTE